MKIKTVCGEIDKAGLGIVASHEHVLLDLTAFYQELPVPGIEDPATQKVEMWNLGSNWAQHNYGYRLLCW